MKLMPDFKNRKAVKEARANVLSTLLESEGLEHLEGHVHIEIGRKVMRVKPIDAYAREIIGVAGLEFSK